MGERTTSGVRFGQARLVLAVLTVGALAACATVSNTADRINPFSGDEPESDAAPGADRRVSLIALDPDLAADDSLDPATIVVPAPRNNPAWPNEGGFAHHAPQHLSLPEVVEKAWTRDIGAGSSRQRRVSAPPIVGAGRIYTMDGESRVTAVSTDTGREAWDIRLRSDSKRDREARGGGLAFGDGRVYATTGFGVIAGLSADTGEELWRRDLGSPLHAPPTAVDGRVFAIGFDNELFALNAETGALLWTYQSLSEPARILTASSPAVVGDVVIAPFASGEVVALRVENGRQIWSDALGRSGGTTALASLNDIAGSPVVHEGVVYAMSHSGVFAAFDLRTGTRLWDQPAGGIHMPWLAGDVAYVLTNEAEVAAISRIDGRVYWVRELERYKNPANRKGRIAWAGPTLAGGRLWVVSTEGDMLALDPTSGETVEDYRVGDPVFIPPIVAGDTLYLLTDDARLIAYR